MEDEIPRCWMIAMKKDCELDEENSIALFNYIKNLPEPNE